MKTDKKRKDPAEPFSLPSETGDSFPDDDEELRENERFRQGILEAWETYCADSLKPGRPLDLSFLPEEVAAMLREEEPEQSRELPSEETEKNTAKETYTKTETRKQQQVRPSARHFRQWAAAILLCAVLTGGMTWWMNSQYAYAARFHLERILYQLSGNYYVSDPEEDGSTDTITIRIDDPQDLDRAARFMPELLTPGSLPEDWQFAGLDLMKTLDGEKQASLTYENHEAAVLLIEESYPAAGQTAEGEKETGRRAVTPGGRTVYLYRDSVTDLPAATFVENRVQVRVSGDLAEAQLLEVAGQMAPVETGKG